MKKVLVVCIVVIMGVSTMITGCSKSPQKSASSNNAQVTPAKDVKKPVVSLDPVSFLKGEDLDATRLAYTINIEVTKLDLTEDLKTIYANYKKSNDSNVLVDKTPIDVFRLFYNALKEKDAKTAMSLMDIPAGKDTKTLEENIKSGNTKFKELEGFNNRIVQIKDMEGKEFLVFQGKGKYQLVESNKVWKVSFID